MKTGRRHQTVQWMKRISIWKRLMLMGTIPLAILVIVIGTLSYRQADSVVKQSEKQVLSDTINRIDININVKARQMVGGLQTIVESKQASDLTAWFDAGCVGSFDGRELQQLCKITVESFADVGCVTVVLDQQVIYQSDLHRQIPSKQKLNVLYAEAKKYPNKTIWSDLTGGLYPTDDSNREILVYEGIHNQTGDTVGLIVLELSPRNFGSSVSTKQRILDYQTTFLADHEGSILYSDYQVKDAWMAQIGAAYKEGLRKFMLQLDGVPYFVCAQYNGMTGFITYTMIPEDKLFFQAESLHRYIMVLIVISVVLATVIMLLVSNAITGPLKRLNIGMKQVQNKNFELQLPNDRGDEVGQLTDSFNFMVNRINVLVNQIYRERIAQKNAELEALQAQINPHFLYNTLDSVNWMLLDRGDDDISSIVVALGKLMQYTMDTSTSMVTLGEEYNHVRDYLMIQKNRLEERLEFHLSLQEGLEAFPVPKLILQPLVENAIKHGIEPVNERGVIHICASRQKNRLRIQVKDNGAGMTQEQLEKYCRLLQNETAGHTSIGVRNVARRLQLHFGGNCDFLVDSSVGGGLSITIAIPMDETGGERE